VILTTTPHQTLPEKKNKKAKATKSYRLSRQNLEKLYLVYIRPIFEYACDMGYLCSVLFNQA
jgi:hypothetical protein